MNYYLTQHAVHGECLHLDNGIIEVLIPLNFGIRICHFSFVGEKNVFYEHPNDADFFTTDKGWRIRGGHRLWLAPESEKVYFPDNNPISYTVCDDKIILTQQKDEWLNVVKSLTLSFDGARLKITHQVKNVGTESLSRSLWAISVMAPGGTEYINFERRDGGMDHWHRISTWDYTSLGDARATYTRDSIVIKHLPLDEKYKIGVGHPYGPVRYENGDIAFIKHFNVEKDKLYPDANVSYETFFSKYMVEMESLSPLFEIKPGESAIHEEILELKKLKDEII